MSKISPKDVARAIYSETENKSGEELARSIQNSVEFLARKNLMSKAPEILKHLERIHDSEQNIVRVKVESRGFVTEEKKDELKEVLKARYKARDVILEFEQNLALIHGLRIEGKDEVIDLTLKNKIKQLQNYLLDYSTQN